MAAATVSFAVKAVTNNAAMASGGGARRVLSGLWIALAILFLRSGLMACLARQLSFSYLAAFFIAAPVSCLVYSVATARYVFHPATRDSRRDQNWPILCLALIAYSVLLRLFYLGLPEILHEEGYYWNYAQHLDLGYLDHPPLVGWGGLVVYDSAG